jgi:hypothetical protein
LVLAQPDRSLRSWSDTVTAAADTFGTTRALDDAVAELLCTKEFISRSTLVV